MKILLDTHVFVWSKINSPRLSASAWSILRDPANQLFLSSISIAEISIKTTIGKLTLDVPVAEFVLSGMRNAQIEEVPLRAAHAIRLAGIPLHHRDPFDRLLVATALEEDMTLLTDDLEIPRYPVRTVF